MKIFKVFTRKRILLLTGLFLLLGIADFFISKNHEKMDEKVFSSIHIVTDRSVDLEEEEYILTIYWDIPKNSILFDTGNYYFDPVYSFPLADPFKDDFVWEQRLFYVGDDSIRTGENQGSCIMEFQTREEMEHVAKEIRNPRYWYDVIDSLEEEQKEWEQKQKDAKELN